MRAEDVLPNDQDHVELDGITIRKGSVGAFLANARIWCNESAGAAERQAAERDILAALPALRALGLFDVLAVRDERLRALVEKCN
ncbi:hypothetical protein [Cupriavidus sp. AU9028]|uniref:hypothetical protein n=1 Tax=Cupriavidus sp. AU9028 TaxID=2871157 RepID=UPI001C959455|nr:hypothetical protein [Cupriavidus sp. AU9028]MBY4897189.1 hypothetical protein [Cupriavidus sp. AU9028]